LKKHEAVSTIRKLGFEQLVCIGDGANDVSMFKEADISIAFAGVHSPAKDLVLSSNYLVYQSDNLCKMLNTL
jgi:P-type E1-E2 ATPase